MDREPASARSRIQDRQCNGSPRHDIELAVELAVENRDRQRGCHPRGQVPVPAVARQDEPSTVPSQSQASSGRGGALAPTRSARPFAGWRHVALMALVSVCVTLAAGACGSTGERSAGQARDSTSTPDASGPKGSAQAIGTVSGTITVSAATSLADVFPKIGQDFKAANPAVSEVRFNFDSSGTLAKQILGGAPADSFASADTESMDRVRDANELAGDPAVFARNKLTIVVKKGNPTHIKSLADLAGSATVSLCGSDVPCGRYADKILRSAGVTIPPERITRGHNVKAALGAVANGDADAGIVYVTDVSGDQVEAVPIPDADNEVATYSIAVLSSAANRSAAQAFVDYVLSPAGQAKLAGAGFLPVEAGPSR